MSHTLGPWKAFWNETNKRTKAGSWIFVSESAKKNIYLGGTSEGEANAKLIAAAPALLEHAKRLVALLPNIPLVIAGTGKTDKWINEVWDTLRAAGVSTSDVHDRLPRAEAGEVHCGGCACTPKAVCHQHAKGE